MSQLEGLDFSVNRTAWHETRLDTVSVSTDLSPGQVLFRIDRFALTSNNISYAGAGDMLGYWKFFPAEEGWGRIPLKVRGTYSDPKVNVNLAEAGKRAAKKVKDKVLKQVFGTSDDEKIKEDAQQKAGDATEDVKKNIGRIIPINKNRSRSRE